jgi:hypothetical protein
VTNGQAPPLSVTKLVGSVMNSWTTVAAVRIHSQPTLRLGCEWTNGSGRRSSTSNRCCPASVCLTGTSGSGSRRSHPPMTLSSSRKKLKLPDGLWTHRVYRRSSNNAEILNISSEESPNQLLPARPRFNPMLPKNTKILDI